MEVTALKVFTVQERRDRIQEALNYDQITEIRHAVAARREELEKLKKKEADMGLDPHEIRTRLRVIDGDETNPGLLVLIRTVDAFVDDEADPDQMDALYDAGQERGDQDRDPRAEEKDEGEEEEEAVGVEVWPTPEIIEEARSYLSRHGWPQGEEEYPDEPLARTIRLVSEVGWGEASRMALQNVSDDEERADEGEGVEEDVGKDGDGGETAPGPQVGQVVKCAENRRYKFRIVKVFSDRVELENSRGKALRPFVALETLEWDEDAGYWLVHAVDPEVFHPQGTEDDYVPEAEDEVVLPAEAEVAGAEGNPDQEVEKGPEEEPPVMGDHEVLGVDVGDPVVVMDGEELVLHIIGPIEVMEPRWTKILDEAGENVLGRTHLGRLKWDSELRSWAVPSGMIDWAEEPVSAHT